MSANTVRGEVDVVVNGKAYVLRPTFDAIARIESELGVGTIQLSKRLLTGAGMTEMMSLLFHGIEASGEKVQREEIAEALVTEGITAFIKPATDFLKAYLVGTRSVAKAKGEAAAMSEKAKGDVNPP